MGDFPVTFGVDLSLKDGIEHYVVATSSGRSPHNLLLRSSYLVGPNTVLVEFSSPTTRWEDDYAAGTLGIEFRTAPSDPGVVFVSWGSSVPWALCDSMEVAVEFLTRHGEEVDKKNSTFAHGSLSRLTPDFYVCRRTLLAPPDHRITHVTTV